MSKKLFWFKRHSLLGILMLSLSGLMAPVAQAALDIAQVPLFLSSSTTPLVMLVMGRDHKLYYEAYNDASDLNGDGILDVGYKPNAITYFGYFDSNKCYTYGSDVFTPSGAAASKKCSGQWSGDFLNYLTTSRMDAMRKVLYGGYRSTDTASETILERSYIPQEAHSWGKEYKDLATDGYLITDYTPLSMPSGGTRHLFANATLLSGDGKPLLRVLTNSNYRIWEWVSIERPVAGTKCVHGGSGPDCETSGSTIWEIVPSSYLTLTQTIHKITTRNSSTGTSHPNSSAQFDALVLANAITANLCGSQSVSTINGSGNPFNGTNGCTNDNYLTVFTGQINIATAGTYTFSVDGDDAVDLKIDGTAVAGWYDGHGSCNCHDHPGSITLTAGIHTIQFRHEEGSGGDSYYLRWQRTIPASVRTDYTVRVKVCADGSDDSCRGYPAASPTVYKPAGLLQEYGEDSPERMAFGLLSGSYKKNTSGGVLRKNIGPFAKEGDANTEVNLATGQFNGSVVGIAKTLDKLKIVDFGGNYEYGCGWITTRPINEGECYMWGNPVGEMMYETLRYFSSKTAPSSAFDYSGTTPDSTLGLPKPTWQDPFRSVASGGYSGSKCFMLTISDLPSYDSDQVPGSSFGSFTGDINSSSMNATTLANAIWAGETADNNGNPKFIGQSGSVSDNAPTAKSVSGFGTIRGLSPEEPTKQGSFYASAMAYFGNKYGIGATEGKQRVETLSVVLSSPLPRIVIPVGGKTITLVPFAKSTGGSSISLGNNTDANPGFQPTDQIVDFYVEKIVNDGGVSDSSVNGGRPYGKFRINYEDVEQGADHDMDAIVVYEFLVNADDTVTVNLTSEYAAGGIIQYMGYVISGTDGQDGVYLDVRDKDTGAGSDPIYRGSTPPATTTDASGMTLARASWPVTTGSEYWNYRDSATSEHLKLTATRKFKLATAGSLGSAGEFIKHDPFWYAAKWGGFTDTVNQATGTPDQTGEWDTDGDGVPDNYFLVTNAGKLKEQLSSAFQAILSKRGSASLLAVESAQVYGGGCLYQAKFNSQNWTGQVLAIQPTSKATGTLNTEPCNESWTDAGEVLDALSPSTRTIITRNPLTGFVSFEWGNLSDVQKALLSPQATTPFFDATEGAKRVAFLRGDATNEGDGTGQYRKRDTSGAKKVEDPISPKYETTGSTLGDIVNSSPVFVSFPSLRYRDSLETPTHASFRIANASRAGMIYVGANDGMLHGFSAADGSEKFAYIPSTAYKELARLTKQSYNTADQSDPDQASTSEHRYFVDSTPYVGDAFYDSAWHTVLIGRLGAGGQGTFALDVTDPSATFTTSKVLWELTDVEDADLGYTYGKAVINKTNNGEWAAIFGNGINNTTADGFVGNGQGVLFIVNAKTGAVIKKINTGVTSDGLSTPYTYDVDGDNKVDWIYAGDVEGRMWKFDVRDASPINWVAKLLFTAATGQSITSSPITIENPEGGVMVLFGTGRYLGESDKTNVAQQTYYAIWDREYWGADGAWGGSDDVAFATITSTSSLVQQAFTGNVTVDNKVYRVSTGQEVCWWKDPATSPPDCSFTCEYPNKASNVCEYKDSSGTVTVSVAKGASFTLPATALGWYLNLPDVPAADSGAGSERVYTDSELNDGRIVFVSNAPTESDADPDPCETVVGNGKSWLNMLDALTGKRLDETFRKVDEQGKVTPISVTDPVTGQVVPATSLEGEGLSPGQKTITDPTTDTDYVAFCHNDGTCDVIGIPAGGGRMSWRQLQFQ